MGFVLNKKTDLIVNTFFPELEEYPEIPIYLGGSVSANRLFFIHSLGDLIVPDSVKIKDRLYFDGDFEALKRYIQNGHSIEGKVKFFLGYSGWTEGQLGNEINKNSWVVSHAAKENVLLADGESFWKNSLEQLGSNYEAWTKYPERSLSELNYHTICLFTFCIISTSEYPFSVMIQSVMIPVTVNPQRVKRALLASLSTGICTYN